MKLKIIPIFTVLAAVAVIGTGCSREDMGSSGNLRNVTFDEAVKMIGSENPPVVVDVRTPGEFNNELGHIPGARLIPMDLTADSMAVYAGLSGRDILLVCRSGRRSGLVGRQLVEAGLKRIYNLQGGMNAWNENGGQVERIDD